MLPRGKSRPQLVVAVLLLMMAASGGCADMVLLRPTKNPCPCPGADAHQVAGKHPVEVFVERSPACRNEPPQAFVLGFTGNNGRAEEMVGWMSRERWGDFPVEVWMVNYPGFGHSPGPATLDSIVPAALEVYDALHAAAGGRPIFIDGNSFGAAVALHVATVRPAAALVLKNAPPLTQILLERNGWWNLYLLTGPMALQVPHELDAPTMAAKLTVPAAFMVAEGDTLVPPHYQAYVFDAYAGPKTIIRMPNLQHIDRADAKSEKTLHDWIALRWQQTFPTATAMHPALPPAHLITSPDE